MPPRRPADEERSTRRGEHGERDQRHAGRRRDELDELHRTPLDDAAERVDDRVGLACRPSGRRRLTSRRSSCQSTGSSMRPWSLGPVGPLYGPRGARPIALRTPSQASGSSGRRPRSGSTTTSGSIRVDGPSVLSQPNPSLRAATDVQRRAEVAGVRPLPTSTRPGGCPRAASLASSQSARSPPSCWA